MSQGLSQPFNLSRGQWQAACWRMAGDEWDRWDAEATWGLSSNAYAWATRTEAEVLAERDAAMAAALARYRETPEWTAQDTHDERVTLASGRDPRRALALRQAVQAEQAAKDARVHAKRLKTPPCAACGYGAGHGHHPLCSEAA